MPITDQSHARRERAALYAIIAGVTAIFVSLIWSSLPLHRALWSDDQARQYQVVSARLHELAHQFGEQAPHTKSPSTPAELEQAQHEYDQLRHQLDAARGAPERISSFIFWSGVLLTVVGAASYWQSDQ